MTLSSPGIKRGMDEGDSATGWSKDHASTYRSVRTGINYLAQDRTDIIFAAQEMARWISQPNTTAWEIATRCCRCQLGKPRMVIRDATSC